MQKTISLIACLLTLFACSNRDNYSSDQSSSPPNIIFIMVDDLGYGDMGAYGQQYIKTPNLDRLARGGTVFTQYYAGSTVCAPSRASLMLGLHTGHSPVRGNVGWDRGDMPLRTTDTTFVQLLDQAGYHTGMYGKWSLGLKGTSGAPSQKGFDTFLGYEDQTEAHSYYMNTLQEIDQGVTVNVDVDTTQYTHDLFVNASLDFIKQHQKSPFFLYLPLTIPHAALEVPEESLQPYLDKEGKSIFPEPKHSETGNYAETNKPLATYAAMVSRLDKGIGLIRKRLEHLGIADNTIIFFTSDNGPHSEGGYDPTYFDSNGPFRGQKRDLYEGGIRVPMIVWGPNFIPANRTNNQMWAEWDVAPTLLDITNNSEEIPADGVSMKDVLTGSKNHINHPNLYWEFNFRDTFRQALRKGSWKAIRYTPKNGNQRTELYDMQKDSMESQNVAAKYPQKVDSLNTLMDQAHQKPVHPEFIVPWVDE